MLRELWEEAGLRGRVTWLLGLFDGRHWGSRSKVHLVHFVFLVDCAELSPVPGMEMLAARFFPPHQLPQAMHHGHDLRVPKVVELWQSGETFFDPAASDHAVMPMRQRPAE